MFNFVGYYLAFSIGGFYALWLFYLAVMNLSKAKKAGTLSKTALILGTPILFIGYVLDFLMNVFVLSFVLLEIPQELTCTSRLKRWHKYGIGWRLRIVLWFEPLLDPYDPSGDHI